MQEDKALKDALFHQDAGSEKAVFMALYKELCAYAAQVLERYPSTGLEAEDYVLDAMSVLFANVKTGRLTSLKCKLGTYLCSIITNKIKEQSRKSDRAKVEVPEGIRSSYEEAMQKEALLRCLETKTRELAHDCRQILHFFYRDGLSYDQISSIINRTPGAIRSRCYSCRQNLRNLSQECLKLNA